MARLRNIGYSRRTSQVLGSPRQQISGALTLPAPTLGIQNSRSLFEMDPRGAVRLFNFVPVEEGLRTREGYQEWADTLSAAQTRTLIPVIDRDSANNKLFAVNRNGIYDVTAQETSNPTAEVSFGNNGDGAGFGVVEYYVNDAGDAFVFYADEENGLFEYNVSTDTWAAASGITGPVIANIVYVVAHKERLWFVERDSSSAWYLATGVKGGTATEFNLGSKFSRGGDTVGAYSWTIDGGAGVDDYLVFLSRAGDVLVYQGTDPASASTWALVGQWYAGEFPVGRRLVAQYGGIFYMLSTFGIISLNDLLQGSGLQQALQSGPGANITETLRDQMLLDKNKFGWTLEFIAPLALISVVQPRVNRTETWDNVIFQYNVTRRAWGTWFELPLVCLTVFGQDVYFGGDDEKIYRYGNVPLDDVAYDGSGGTAVNWEVMSSFQAIGDGARYHRVHLIRPVMTTVGTTPDYLIQARYDYNMSELTGATPVSPSDVGLWDDSTWDVSIWGGGGVTPVDAVRGSYGFGRRIATRMRGSSVDPVTLQHYDLLVEQGGFL